MRSLDLGHLYDILHIVLKILCNTFLLRTSKYLDHDCPNRKLEFHIDVGGSHRIILLFLEENHSLFYELHMLETIRNRRIYPYGSIDTTPNICQLDIIAQHYLPGEKNQFDFRFWGFLPEIF